MSALAIRVLNWLTNMHWSLSPDGMGCIHPRCQSWKLCKGQGQCIEFGKRDAHSTGK